MCGSGPLRAALWTQRTATSSCARPHRARAAPPAAPCTAMTSAPTQTTIGHHHQPRSVPLRGDGAGGQPLPQLQRCSVVAAVHGERAIPHPGAGREPDPGVQPAGAVAAEAQTPRAHAERVRGAEGGVVAGQGLVEVARSGRRGAGASQTATLPPGATPMGTTKPAPDLATSGLAFLLQGSGSRYRPRPPRHTRTRTWLMVYEHVAVKPRVSLARGAAEADLVAVGVAVDDLAHTVAIRLLRRGLDSSGADGLHPLIQVVDEQRV